MSDHVHVCIGIPPTHAVSNVVGYLKGKSAIPIARKYGGRQRHFTGEHFGARGVSSPPSGSTKRGYGPAFETKGLTTSATIK